MLVRREEEVSGVRKPEQLNRNNLSTHCTTHRVLSKDCMDGHGTNSFLAPPQLAASAVMPCVYFKERNKDKFKLPLVH